MYVVIFPLATLSNKTSKTKPRMTPFTVIAPLEIALALASEIGWDAKGAYARPNKIGGIMSESKIRRRLAAKFPLFSREIAGKTFPSQRRLVRAR